MWNYFRFAEDYAESPSAAEAAGRDPQRIATPAAAGDSLPLLMDPGHSFLLERVALHILL